MLALASPFRPAAAFSEYAGRLLGRNPSPGKVDLSGRVSLPEGVGQRHQELPLAVCRKVAAKPVLLVGQFATISNTLRNELESDTIRVVTTMPGAIATSFARNFDPAVITPIVRASGVEVEVKRGERLPDEVFGKLAPRCARCSVPRRT